MVGIGECRVSAIGGQERKLGPALDWNPLSGGGMPSERSGEDLSESFERGIVRRRVSLDHDRLASGGHLDQ